jgi:UDP-3-O-[3-hydroxymyristoyl] glucosamine N-acyltransferase
LRAADIAARLGATLSGEDCDLEGAAPLETAQSGDLAFAGSAKSFEAARRSRAGCIVAPPEFEPGAGQTVIPHSSPRAAFAQALPWLYPPRPRRPGVHPSAVIDSSAEIAESAEIGPLCNIGEGARVGERTRIGSGCHIGARVSIGSDCLLHSGVVLYERVQVGDRVILHSNCVLGADGFGFAPQNGRWIKFPQVGFVLVEDDVEIGAGSCIDRAALGITRIGEGSKLDNMVHVGHNCDIGRHVVVAAQTGFSGGVLVGDGAVIGGQVGVGDKARIESGVVLGSGSGVLTSKVVRAGQPLWGVPARPLKEHLEQLALMARLPEIRSELRKLAARVNELEKNQ